MHPSISWNCSVEKELDRVTSTYDVDLSLSLSHTHTHTNIKPQIRGSKIPSTLELVLVRYQVSIDETKLNYACLC
jgi:hypothetical protein